LSSIDEARGISGMKSWAETWFQINNNDASRPLRAMIARPKTSRREWETAGIGAFEVGNVAPVSRPDEDVDVPFELVLPQVALAAAVVGPHGELRLGDAGLAVHAVVEVARGDARVLVARQLEELPRAQGPVEDVGPRRRLQVPPDLAELLVVDAPGAVHGLALRRAERDAELLELVPAEDLALELGVALGLGQGAQPLLEPPPAGEEARDLREGRVGRPVRRRLVGHEPLELGVRRLPVPGLDRRALLGAARPVLRQQLRLPRRRRRRRRRRVGAAIERRHRDG
jgi:hypothetical protein